jgi:uncharacterized membrane protein (DUF485 family)
VPPPETIDWQAIARSPEFAALEAARRRVVVAMLSVFGLAMGVFLILCGYARPFMDRSDDGGLTVAYVAAWSDGPGLGAGVVLPALRRAPAGAGIR